MVFLFFVFVINLHTHTRKCTERINRHRYKQSKEKREMSTIAIVWKDINVERQITTSNNNNNNNNNKKL
jgi:hypothetical protein